MNRDDRPRPVGAHRCQLGECPVWHPLEQALYFVDATAPAIHRLEPDGSLRSWPLPAPIGSFAFRAKGGAVLALGPGFALFDFSTGALEWIARPEADRPENRFNDGAVDPAGRFWAGSMHAATREATASLYRLDADRRVTRVLGGTRVTNGIGWSPDGRTLYFADSPTRCISAFDVDETGALSGRRVFVRLTEDAGYPDGLTVDAEGCIWSAHWRGARVSRYRPDGRLERAIPMPVDRPTSVTFGGTDLDTLYITSARAGLSAEALAGQPLAGALFACRPGVRGQPARFYAG